MIANVLAITVGFLGFGTPKRKKKKKKKMQMEKQAVGTLIRLILEEQSDLGRHCLLFKACVWGLESLQYCIIFQMIMWCQFVYELLLYMYSVLFIICNIMVTYTYT